MRIRYNKGLFPTLLSIATLLLLWQIISYIIGYPEIFPSVPALLWAVVSLFGESEFYNSLFSTILRGLAGFGISFALAFVLALFSHFNIFFKDFFRPFLVVVRSLPVISLVLIALLWFSPNGLPVFIALLTMFPVLYQNMLSGFEQVDVRLIEMARVFGRKGFAMLTGIYIPSVRKLMFEGIATATGFGWRAIIIGEVLAQPFSGMGSRMKEAQAYINVSELIAWTFVAVGVSFLFEFIVKKIAIKNSVFTGLKLTKERVSAKQTYYGEHKKIELQNIAKSLGGNQILKQLNFKMISEKVYLLNAPSGKGKTTFLKLLAGIYKADSGTTKHDNIHSIAFSFQDTRLLPWLTVRANIAFALGNHLHITQKDSLEVDYILHKMELSNKANHFPHELSGGQQQRIGLARALIAKADLLLLDEPLNGLDDITKKKVIDFIFDYTESYKPLIVWATHENISTNKVSTDVISL
ncbi:MAG: ATP-binding cassette domain-containing protein [Paludibacteraceae bacterium]|nr:ATP-binding cassette domain-containing protein [Paludibacteraceae bacterium]